MDPLSVDPHLTDPPLLSSNSKFKSYTTSQARYPGIRVFFHEHAKADELYRDNGPLPLLVFIPGLGGSVAQFHPLMSSLIDVAPCLSFDWPGGGRSEYAPTSWGPYSPDALRELVEMIIEDHRNKDAGQTAVLIGHSMGTAYCAMLANPTVPHKTSLSEYIVGVVGICPISSPINEKSAAWGRRLMLIPDWLFDLWRMWDGMGGPESPSVGRFVGKGADAELKLLQYRFNKQSRSPVWKRMFYGLLSYKDGKPAGGFTGLDIWAGLRCPVFLISGENDALTPPAEAKRIFQVLKSGDNAAAADPEGFTTMSSTSSPGAPEPPKTAPADTALADPPRGTTRPLPLSVDDIWEEHFQERAKALDQAAESAGDDACDDHPSTPHETPAAIPPQPRHPGRVVDIKIMPAPATHAVLYAPRTVRAMAGLIGDFLATNVTGRLSLGWQLQYLSREGKWDVKNLKKWRSVNPVSDPIGPPGNPVFRAMKTLREADDVHTPSVFVSRWGPPKIRHVVDISKDQPVYDPRGLERAGIKYHKFPTVSKVPPTAEEVEAFIDLIDALRDVHTGQESDQEVSEDAEGLIGVHCHYGFNRTGYFLVCYLVERCGFTVKEAIEEFAKARPNGIRHSHFLDRLYVRYNLDRE
ncbi:hypothetical protein GMORB2_4386 [Geosmithia morbida]|uniref:Tyrosine specific protein phosphatases domain-containing protein n=1 Tax=Geosmithia morbida TaxID=1094350 RepID=A0A9P5D1D2_9HYPO|nr:uncharacterized protein GMORB2_4386 [Geosmithia morbida]KAF4119720.1 hypothetical protein GMORB2_4386 [Geosmithia morbida]